MLLDLITDPEARSNHEHLAQGCHMTEMSATEHRIEPRHQCWEPNAMPLCFYHDYATELCAHSIITATSVLKYTLDFKTLNKYNEYKLLSQENMPDI